MMRYDVSASFKTTTYRPFRCFHGKLFTLTLGTDPSHVRRSVYFLKICNSRQLRRYVLTTRLTVLLSVLWVCCWLKTNWTTLYWLYCRSEAHLQFCLFARRWSFTWSPAHTFGVNLSPQLTEVRPNWAKLVLLPINVPLYIILLHFSILIL